MNRVLFKSEKQNWKTPKAFYQALNAEFNFDFDPCPEFPKIDGLNSDWGRRNFVNPPYKNIRQWMFKALHESIKGNLVVALVPARTDTRWWHDVAMKSDEIRFIKGRLYFDDGNAPAPFPSAVIIFNKKGING